MRKIGGVAAAALGASLTLAIGVAHAAPAVWYVVPGGSDANTCAAPAQACATINAAIGKASGGDIVEVAVGSYTGTGDQVVLGVYLIVIGGLRLLQGVEAWHRRRAR